MFSYFKKGLNARQRHCAAILCGDHADLGHRDTVESVSLGIFPFTGLKKSGQRPRFRGIGQFPELRPDSVDGRQLRNYALWL